MTCRHREHSISHHRPRLKAPRSRSMLVESLFPDYIFTRIGNVEESIEVRYTWGVKSILGYNDHLCPVDEEVVVLIGFRESNDGCICPLGCSTLIRIPWCGCRAARSTASRQSSAGICRRRSEPSLMDGDGFLAGS